MTPSIEELWAHERPGLVRLAHQILRSATNAEDVVQEAFVVLDRTDGVDNPAAFLRVVVTRRSIDLVRRSSSRRRALERHARSADPTTDAPDELWDAIGALPVERRAAIVLRYYLDLPDREIAELLGVREATVRTRIHRALRELRKVLPHG